MYFQKTNEGLVMITFDAKSFLQNTSAVSIGNVISKSFVYNYDIQDSYIKYANFFFFFFG